MNVSSVAEAPQAPVAALQPLWKKAISFPVFLAFALAGGIFVPIRHFMVDPDLWWHIKVGATILATHHFPTHDTYSFTVPGSPWIAYEWLGELLLAKTAALGGLQGLLALNYLLATVTLFALYALTTERCGNSKAGIATCALLIPLVFPSCTLRPQMLGYLLLVLTLYLLLRFSRGHTAALWFLPPLFLVWVNTHGSFTIGLFAFAVYFAGGLVEIQWGNLSSRLWTAGERLRLEIAGLLILVALTITPYGTQTCLYPLNMAFSQPINVANIQEWQSMTFGDVYGKLFLALVLGFLFAQVTLKPKWELPELVLFLVGVTAACIHLRFLLVFVPYCAPLLAVLVAYLFPPYNAEQDKYVLNAVLMTAIVAGVIHFFPSRSTMETMMQDKWPVRAVAYLKAHPVPQPMFNTYGYGGYLIWQLDGQNKVFIDGRGDIYERQGVFSDYLDISRLVLTTPMLLKAYNIQSCLVNRDDALATWLEAVPGWRKVYSDPLSVLFVRTGKDAGKAGQ